MANAVVPPTIIGREEARALDLKCYFSGKPCKHGHVAARYVSSGGCMECVCGHKREWRAANPEKARERDCKSRRAWRAANLEKIRERDRLYARKYRAANPERVRENWRRWRAANEIKPSGEMHALPTRSRRQ
jgi:hypothetical protein